MFRFLTAAVLMTALTACLPVPPETQAALDSVEATGKPPVATQEQRQTDYADCEVKNNKGGPCLIAGQGGTASQNASARERAMAVPVPAECQPFNIEVDYDNGYTDGEVEAITAKYHGVTRPCSSWLDSVSFIDPSLASLMYPEERKPKDQFEKKVFNISLLHKDNIVAMANVLTARDEANKRRAEAKRQAASSRSNSAPRSESSTMCANPYGGASARHDEYICSNHGELLACQCSGGSCGLISTQSYLCSQAGAVVR